MKTSTNNIDSAIAAWEALAAKEEADTRSPCAANRARTYRRTAESLRLEKEAGEPHCVCCLLPLGKRGPH